MYCNHCKKEQETITIAGKTYCASCSTVLSDKKVGDDELPKHKMPKIEATDNGIRTEQITEPPKEIDPEIRDMAREMKIADVNKDDLEGSAILLDILSDKAKDSLDEETLNDDKKLAQASEEVIDILSKNKAVTSQKPNPTPQKKVERPHTHQNSANKIMNDIRPSGTKKADHPKFESMKKAEEEIKKEAQSLGRIVTQESGYTKEYDLMIMSIVLTAIIMVIVAVFMTFR